MMLTSSQWPGVVIFVSKQCTYVFVFTIDCTLLIQYFVRGLSPSGKVVSYEPPLPLGNNCL